VTTIEISVAPFAKARPRATRGPGVYMPRSYVASKRAAVIEMRKAWGDRRTIMETVSVTILLITASGNMRPDIDNAAGGVLDAMQDAGILGNDKQVRRLTATVLRGEPRTVIHIEPMAGNA